MNFVLTKKQPLNEANYPFEITELPRNREFHTTYPAPVSFNIPATTKAVSEDTMQLLATWFCRGTRLTHNGVSIVTKHKPIVQWVYSFTPKYLKHYQNLGYTTTQQCYDYGQQLIARCTKASAIPFAYLEEAYKRIMSAFWNSSTVFFSPNSKTFPEVSAEKQTIADIKALTYAEDTSVNSRFTDEELKLYSRIFGVSIPNYCLRYSHLETPDGFARTPSVSMTDEFKLSYVSERKGGKEYSGSAYEPEDIYRKRKDGRKQIKQGIIQTPYTLKLDERPTPLVHSGLRAQLAEQVAWCCDTFKTTKDLTLLANGWGYCDTCGFYKTADGCQCGACLSQEAIELQQIRDAEANIQTFNTVYEHTLEEIAQWANENLPIDNMDNEEILRAVFNYFGSVR